MVTDSNKPFTKEMAEEFIRKHGKKSKLPIRRKKKVYAPGLTLGIIGTVFAFILPVVTFACSIPGLVTSVKAKNRRYDANAGIALNIVAISLAGINSVIGTILVVRKYLKNKD